MALRNFEEDLFRPTEDGTSPALELPLFVADEDSIAVGRFRLAVREGQDAGQIVVSGQITNASGGAWGVFDDFSLTPYTASTVDTSGLAALVDQANGLTRSVYSEDSIESLDSALRIADIVLDATLPTQQQVDDAAALVTSALAGLVIVGEVPGPTVTNPTVTAVDGTRRDPRTGKAPLFVPSRYS